MYVQLTRFIASFAMMDRPSRIWWSPRNDGGDWSRLLRGDGGGCGGGPSFLCGCCPLSHLTISPPSSHAHVRTLSTSTRGKLSTVVVVSGRATRLVCVSFDCCPVVVPRAWWMRRRSRVQSLNDVNPGQTLICFIAPPSGETSLNTTLALGRSS
jgi:hypothetical protein